MAVTSPPKLGRYEIVEEIGKGAMGVVYLARDPLIGRLVALKTFRVGFSVGDEELHQFRARFMREAQSAGILSHPNIVTIHDVQDGSSDGFSFIAMEYVPGVNLKELLQRDELLELEFVVSIISQVASALDYAHSKGVIHRDVKPANVIIDLQKRVKITDFGIARLESSNLTQDGQLLGTPNYMAPEQILGRELDHRVDVFSLGVVLYELLTRRKPFQGENLTIVSHRIAFEDFTPPRQFLGSITPEIETVLGHALAKDPVKRYGSAGVLADEFRTAVAAGLPPKPPGADSGAVRLADPPAPQPPVVPPPTSLTPPPTAALVPTVEPPVDPASLAPPLFDTRPGSPERSPGPPVSIGSMPAVEPLIQAAPAASSPPAPDELAVAPRSSPGKAGKSAKEGRSKDDLPAEPIPAVSWMDLEVPLPLPPTVNTPAPSLAGATPAAKRVAPQPVRAGVQAGGLLRAAGLGLFGGAVLAGGLFALRPDASALPRPSAEHELLTRLLPHLRDGVQLELLGDSNGALVAFKEAERIAPDRASIKRHRQRLEDIAANRTRVSENDTVIAALLATGEEAFARRRYQDAADKAHEALALQAAHPLATDLLARSEVGLAARSRQAGRPGGTPAVPPIAAAPPAAVAAPPAASVPAGDPVLVIDFMTEMSEGALTIYVNKKQVLLEPFKFVKRTGILRSEPSAGRVQDQRTLSAGDSTIQVYVTPAGKPARAVTLQGNFPAGSRRVLRIVLSKAAELTATLE